VKKGQMGTKKKMNLTISTDTPPSTSYVTESPTMIESPLLRATSKRKNTIMHNLFTDRRARRASILTMDEYGQTTHKYAQMTNLTLSQNFILRHVALIALHPLLGDVFSLDSLIALVEQPSAPTTPSVLWGKIITHIKSSNARTFGAPLVVVAQRDHDYLVQRRKESNHGVTLRDDTPTLTACFSEHAFIPIFIKTCIRVILQTGKCIFRHQV
jgi:hypothetical protein